MFNYHFVQLYRKCVGDYFYVSPNTDENREIDIV